MVTTFAIITFAIFTTCVALGFWGRCINKGTPAMLPVRQEKFKFTVIRDVKVADKKYVRSTVTVFQETCDPFRTGNVILEHYREQGFTGFVEGISFESATDEEFELFFGEGQGRR